MILQRVVFGLVIGALTFGMSSPVAAKRVALVIGNAAYSALGVLKNPANDANDMSTALSQLGFDVHKVLDGNRRTMLDQTRQFEANLPGAEVAFFFYAGHGVQYQGRNYLIPIKAPIASAADLEVEAIDAQRILRAMELAKSQANIIVLDACRNNPFARKRGVAIASNSAGLASMESISGSLISYATQPGNTASDGTGRNGTYTEQLLQYIKKPGLDIVQMFNQVSFAVLQVTDREQQPWIHFSAIPPLCLAGCDVVGNPLSAPAAPEAKRPLPEMLPISSGLFRMGDLQGIGDLDERPVQSRRVKGVDFAKFEITVSQFSWFVENTGYRTTAERAGGCWEWTGQSWSKGQQRSWKNPGFSQRDDSPVVCVSWHDATAYAKWLSEQTGQHYRLPTEAEWEYSARAGIETPYLSGSSIGHSMAHCTRCPGSQYGNGPAPVGSFKPNPFGLFDMQGNVWEWVTDSYAPYGQRPTNPDRRVARGGSWIDIPKTLRLSNRIRFASNSATTFLGFRVIRAATP